MAGAGEARRVCWVRVLRERERRERERRMTTDDRTTDTDTQETLRLSSDDFSDVTRLKQIKPKHSDQTATDDDDQRAIYRRSRLERESHHINGNEGQSCYAGFEETCLPLDGFVRFACNVMLVKVNERCAGRSPTQSSLVTSRHWPNANGRHGIACLILR